MKDLSKTGRAAVVYLLLAGLQRGISLLILPFISHVMSPAQFGAASILTATALLLVAIVAAPLEQLVFRASARGGTDAPALIRAVGVYCYFILPLLTALIAVAVGLFLPELLGLSGGVWAIEILAIGLQPAATYFALPFVRARQDLQKFLWLAVTSVLVTAVSKIVFIVVMKLDVLGWALSDLVSGIVSAAVAMALVRLPRTTVDRGHIRAVVSFSVPLIPHRASFWALLSLNRPAMSLVASLTQVGLLSFGLNLASVATMIIAEFQQAVLPRYSRETFPAPTDETRQAVKSQLIMAVIAPSVVGAGVAITGPWIFAEPYWPSFAVTGILLCGQVAYGLYLIPMNYLVQAAGLPKFSGLASVSGAIIILVGIFAFGREFGAVGVAYATAIGFFVMALVAFLLTWALKLRIRWKSWGDCWPQMSVGVASLACTVAALTIGAGSKAPYVMAAVSLMLAAGALLVSTRRNQPKRRPV